MKVEITGPSGCVEHLLEQGDHGIFRPHDRGGRLWVEADLSENAMRHWAVIARKEGCKLHKVGPPL
jgi:hypothetical protein